mmetsp:Transcript_59649/g.73028  ORF Transcript_59649/g.73028 Transcript_59649/m.73028 type:complete len:129 (+) Transcript_59649:31-417(+)
MAKIRDVRVADPFASAAIVLKCTNCGHVSQYDTRATKKTEKPCPVCKIGIMKWDGRMRKKNNKLQFNYKPNVPKTILKYKGNNNNDNDDQKSQSSSKKKPKQKAPKKKLPSPTKKMFKPLPKPGKKKY